MSLRPPRIAFYAPMKGPDHPVPSGDRTVARLYRQALLKAGFEVDTISDFRSYDGTGDPDRQATLLADAAAERARIAAEWRISGAPHLWFTYHLYHKAPDLLGPELSREFALPYAVAEPSHAPKRAQGPWATFYQHAEQAIRHADAVFIATTADAECVTPLRGTMTTLLIPPFMDGEGWSIGGSREQRDGPVRLITVAMMRAGDKAHSYALLAEALNLLPNRNWTLDILGDGPARAEVEASFAPFRTKTQFHGTVTDRAELSALFAAADIYVWPAVNEAYGMAFLEAQLHRLPVVAGREGGVADVVQHGKTGVLTPPRDAAAFAEALAVLMANAPRRRAMGQAAHAFVAGERLIDHAAQQLRETLMPMVLRTHA